ncbi:GNAT family N-acetyltransferase [Variovorax sp. JS1663]|uniref:GNAT family N-acetyltransferase n=1 Tax=Variovorax sp. JS1663 TaxID=1851577 RepID=UPI000B349E55|nr:GNAT family N-acetyltransferase [Variovorax sp. JS1663]OUM01604.1 acetyltransferase [Variovorax sp. JS1663]
MNSKQADAPAPDARRYPRSFEAEGKTVEIDELRAADEAALLAFAQALPAHDLLFTYRDISQPRVIKAWLREAVERRRMPSLVARLDGQVIGCSALIHDDLSWSPHVGELRVVVGPQARGLGLGRQLVQDSFAQALALGLEKLTAQMTTDQRGSISMFESLGFRPEALLAGHVRGRDGAKHDVVVLSHDVAEVAARLTAYGVGA